VKDETEKEEGIKEGDEEREKRDEDKSNNYGYTPFILFRKQSFQKHRLVHNQLN
jgi:hypothetical protein